MVKGIFAFAAFLALLACPLAIDICTVNYYLDVPVHVIDSNYMDAGGVNVTVTYQKSSTHFTPGPEHVTTEPKMTNDSGMAVFKIKNDVPNARYLDCNIKVNASLMNYSKVTTVTLKDFFKEFKVNISAKRAWITMKDSANYPIRANLTLYPGIIYDINGSMELLLPFGATPGFIDYMGHRQAVVINVNNGTPYYIDVVFKTYVLEVRVFDDAESPLRFSVQAGSEAPVNGTGSTTIQLVDSPSTIKVSALGLDETRIVNPESRDVEVFYIDVHSPSISNIRISPSDGKTLISYSVSDPGKKASGVMETGIYINDVYYAASVVSGVAKATVAPTGDFGFNITATDNDGNRATVSGSYVSGSTSTNNTNGTGDGTTVSAGGEDNSWMFIALGILVVIILIYMFTHGSGGDSSDASI
jgi:hypothetical protein